jgi:Mn-containing catalase
LEEEGLGRTPVPANLPQELEKQEVAYQFIDASEDPESQQGTLGGRAICGRQGPVHLREALTDVGRLGQADPRTYGRRHLPSLRKRRNSLCR